MPQKRDKNSEFAITLRERLTDLRKEKLKLTQTEFAKYVGISTSSVGLYETGERIPDAETLYKISSKCNVSTDYLLGISSVSTTDTDIKTICESTGLSEESANVLMWCKQLADTEYTDTINFIIESELNTVLVDYEIDTLSISEERAKLSHNQKLSLIRSISSYLMGDYKNHEEEIQVSEHHGIESNIGNVILGAYRIKASDVVERVLLDKIVDSLKAAKAYF